MGQLGPKWGQNDVLSFSFVQNALLFADYVYYDGKQWYIAANAGHTAEKLFAGP